MKQRRKETYCGFGLKRFISKGKKIHKLTNMKEDKKLKGRLYANKKDGITRLADWLDLHQRPAEPLRVIPHFKLKLYHPPSAKLSYNPHRHYITRHDIVKG